MGLSRSKPAEREARKDAMLSALERAVRRGKKFVSSGKAN